MHFFYSKTDKDASGSGALMDFPFINDFGFEAYKDIRQKPLELHYNHGIEFCYVLKGRYEWIVDDQEYVLLPGNGFVTCPWEEHGSPHGVVDLGEIYWVVIQPEIFDQSGQLNLGDWTRFTKAESQLIGQTLAGNQNHILQKAHPMKKLFENLKHELENKHFGYYQRVCSLVEEFLISTVRIIQNRESQRLETKVWFTNFDKMIKNDLAHKWTLQEMSNKNDVGITTLTQLLKENTGYSPANYLIYLRLEKAKEMIETTTKSLTQIALDCGFYSSQHFSLTFSKWIGSSPSLYRKNHNS